MKTYATPYKIAVLIVDVRPYVTGAAKSVIYDDVGCDEPVAWLQSALLEDLQLPSWGYYVRSLFNHMCESMVRAHCTMTRIPLQS